MMLHRAPLLADLCASTSTTSSFHMETIVPAMIYLISAIAN